MKQEIFIPFIAILKGENSSVQNKTDSPLSEDKPDEIRFLVKWFKSEMKQRAKSEIEKAANLIKEKHAGANPDRANMHISEAQKALNEGKFVDSIEFAKKAQLAAKPTTEKLLSQAKEFTANAEKSFSSMNYEDAVNLWKKALEDYRCAKLLAQERNENEITEKLPEVEAKLKEQILNGEISIDNRSMHDLIDSGNRIMETANNLYKDRKFDESKNNYETAKNEFAKALSIAEKRDFRDDKLKLEEAKKSIEVSIEAALLSEGDAMLQEAEKSYDEKSFTNAEQGFSSCLEYLKEIKTEKKEELEEMIAHGRKGKIRSKLETGKEKMQSADVLFKNIKYYEAKNSFKTAWSYLQEILDEAAAYELTGFVNELNILIENCSKNITASAKALMKIGTVKSDIKPVERITKGGAEFKRVKGQSEKFEADITGASEPMEIKRGYSVLENKDIKFGIMITNNTDYSIMDAQSILDYSKTLFSMKQSEIYPLGNIDPKASRTATYIIKPLTCTHFEKINAIIMYKDHTGKKLTLTMRPKEVPCVSPLLKEKPISEGEYSRLVENSEYLAEGISYKGISVEEMAKFMGEKAYYLLTAIVQECKGSTQIVLQAHSDKKYRLNRFLSDRTESIRLLVGSVQNAKEIGIIENTQVNIRESVVQRTNIGDDRRKNEF